MVYTLSSGLPAELFCHDDVLAESHCMWSVWHFAVARWKGEMDVLVIRCTSRTNMRATLS